MIWFILGAAAAGLYLWHRGANKTAPYLGTSISLSPTSPQTMTARHNDTLSIIGVDAAQVTVWSTPGALTQVSPGPDPSVANADWGVTGVGTATFTWPGGGVTTVTLTP